MSRKKGLGRGIGAIVSAGPASSLPRELPIEQLAAGPWQPRQRMDPAALADMAKTVAARGVLQPILVRPAAAGVFEIVAGERRWRAARLAGLRTVPVIVREFSNRDALLAAVVENIQREDLHVLDQAAAARRVRTELGMPVKDAALALGMSRPALSNLLRLLELDEQTTRLLAEDKITAGHARALAAVPAARRQAIARAIVSDGLTVRQAEQLAQRALGKKRKTARREVDPDTRLLEDQLSAALGMRVQIRPAGKHGKVVIHYRSLDSLDRLVRKLKK